MQCVITVYNARPGPTTLLWVPGHKGITSNEVADAEVKAAMTTTNDPPRPMSYASARSVIHRTLADLANARTAEVYNGFSWSKDCKEISKRADAVFLERLRVGHIPLLMPVSMTPPQIQYDQLQRGVTDHRCSRLSATPFIFLTTDPEKMPVLARVTIQ